MFVQSDKMEAEISGVRMAVAVVLLITYIIILSVAYSGFFCILRAYATPKKLSAKGWLSSSSSSSLSSLSSTNLAGDEELGDLHPIGVTIIRPIKGIDPEMSSCLRSSFEQLYPSDKIQILFCVDDAQDPLIALLHQICSEYPDIELEVLVGHDYYGPNPKVNNLYKGVERARFDLLWIMDSNVWANRTVLRNSVLTYQYQLNNGKRVNDSRKVKLVHQVPTALSISSISAPSTKHLGAELDEMFLLTSHSKFYVLLNNLSIAPCVNGKLNFYSKSDIVTAVKGIHKQLMPTKFFSHQEVIDDAGHSKHIDFFARYIGEDNMIAIGLWEQLHGRTSGLTGDIVVQPLGGSDNLVKDYIQRRVRWLRVRKYMVLMATLVEPLTESIVCGVYGTVAVSTLWWGQWFKWQWFLLHMIVWVVTDYCQYHTIVGILCQYRNVPTWLRKEQLSCLRRSLMQWLFIWMTRELLALPIWVIAMVGHEIDWRGKPFRIKKDLTAEEL